MELFLRGDEARQEVPMKSSSGVTNQVCAPPAAVGNTHAVLIPARTSPRFAHSAPGKETNPTPATSCGLSAPHSAVQAIAVPL